MKDAVDSEIESNTEGPKSLLYVLDNEIVYTSEGSTKYKKEKNRVINAGNIYANGVPVTYLTDDDKAYITIEFRSILSPTALRHRKLKGESKLKGDNYPELDDDGKLKGPGMNKSELDFISKYITKKNNIYYLGDTKLDLIKEYSNDAILSLIKKDFDFKQIKKRLTGAN